MHPMHNGKLLETTWGCDDIESITYAIDMHPMFTALYMGVPAPPLQTPCKMPPVFSLRKQWVIHTPINPLDSRPRRTEAFRVSTGQGD